MVDSHHINNLTIKQFDNQAIMSTSLIIWGTAFLLYAIFWLWYVGIRRPLSKEEIDYYIKELSRYNNNSEAELVGFRQFLENRYR